MKVNLLGFIANKNLMVIKFAYINGASPDYNNTLRKTRTIYKNEQTTFTNIGYCHEQCICW